MNTALFIAMCVLAILNIILYTFVSSAIHKRDLCQKSPYYHCDTSWQCCITGQDNCDISSNGPQNKVNAYSITDHFYGKNTTTSVGGGTDHRGLQFLICNPPYSASNSSKPYYEACVQPIQVVMKNYDGSKGAPDFACIYNNVTCDPNIAPYLTSAYGVQNFVPGQCCYQKIDPDNSTNAPAPPAFGSPGNLYPRTGNLSAWNTNTAFPNNYNTPTNFIFPVGSNTNTQNNSCNNSLYSAIPGAPYTHAAYSNCPINT
jgi:hypothetical protein